MAFKQSLYEKTYFYFCLLFIFSYSFVCRLYFRTSALHFKKKANCGAYLYNNKTGLTYFCDLEKCKEIMPAIEVFAADEVQGSKKSKIPKFKKKKKSKIPKFKKKSE